MKPSSDRRVFEPSDLKPPGLVERREGLHLLEEALEESNSGSLRFAVLVGPDGIGKSALLSAFLSKASPHPGREEGTPVVLEVDARMCKEGPFVPILALLARIHANIGRPAERPSSTESSGGLDPDLIDFTVGQLRGDGSEDLFAQITSDEGALFRRLGEYLARQSESRTVLVAFENLQDLSPRSASFLDTFLRSGVASRSHFLIVGTYRGDQKVGENEFQKILPRIRRKEFYREATLPPLKPAGVEALLTARLGPLADPRSVVGVVQEATGGNPLRIQETLENLVRRGRVAISEGKVEIDAQPEDLSALPEAMEERLVLRIPKLGKVHLEVLRWCAIARRPVRSCLIEEVAALPPSRIGYLWTDLVRDEYVREIREEKSILYGFLSSRVRQTIYEGMEEKERAKRHLAIAKALESQHEAESGQLAAILAEHFARGGGEKKEKIYSVLAGKAALEAGRPSEAVGFFERALALLGPKGDRVERRRVHLDLARTHLAMDQTDLSRKDGEAARALSKGSEASPCLVLAGDSYLRERRSERASQAFEEARKCLEKRDSPLAPVVGLADAHLEKHLFRRAVELLEGVAEPDPEKSSDPFAARFFLVRGAARERLGEVEPGLQDLATSRSVLARAPEPVLAARSGLETVRILLDTGRTSEARDEYRLVRPAIEGVTSRVLEFERLLVSGRLSAAKGNGVGARERLTEAREFANDRLGDRDRARADLALAHLHTFLREPKSALEAARAARHGFDSLGDLWGKAAGDLAVARAHLMLGKLEEAERELREAAGRFREMGAKGDLARTLVEQVRLLNRTGRHPEGEKILAEAFGIAREIGDHLTEGIALREEGLRYEGMGVRMGARQSLEESVQVLTRSGCRTEARKSRAFLEKLKEEKEG